MERYYYHGFDHFDFLNGIKFMTEILLSGGLKSRSKVRNLSENQYDHVCLYKKNEEYDYSDQDKYMRSSRAAWIDKCMAFVISPSIEAKKVKVTNSIGFDEENEPFTNLVDEWRSVGDIPNKDIVGIAIPMDSIYKYSGCLEGEEKKEFEKAVKTLIDLASELGMSIYNSEEENFTDKLDEQLNKNVQK